MTMLIVGPAIFSLSDPTNSHVSVFTQTMDKLLPEPLPYLGSLVGIFVLMSAAAASAQGLQNLALGLKERHYIPRAFGDLNHYEVANKPVWLEVGIVCVCFLFFGTQEEPTCPVRGRGVYPVEHDRLGGNPPSGARDRRTANGPAQGRLDRRHDGRCSADHQRDAVHFRRAFPRRRLGLLIFIPVLYLAFTYFRRRIGAPSPEMDYLGHIDSNLLAGFGFGQAWLAGQEAANGENAPALLGWMPEPVLAATTG